MKHIRTLLGAFFASVTLCLGNSTVEKLIPPADAVESGMVDARKQFLFLHKPGSEGQFRFILLMELTWNQSPERFWDKAWAYDMAYAVFDTLKADGKNPLAPAQKNDSLLFQASLKYPFLADVTSPQYRDFYNFVKDSTIEYSSITPAVEAYHRYAMVQAAQQKTAQPQHTTTLDHGPTFAEQEAQRAANREASNAANARNAARRSAELARQKEAAAGRSSQTVIIYNPPR